VGPIGIEYYQVVKMHDHDPTPTSETNIVIVVGLVFILLVIVAYLIFWPNGVRPGGSL